MYYTYKNNIYCRTRHQGVYSLVLCTFIGILLSITCHGQQKAEQTVKNFSQAYSRGEIDKIKTLLSPDFAVGIYGKKNEDFLMKTLTAHLSCDSMVYQNSLDIDKATVLLYLKGKDTQSAVFTFDQDGFIRYVDAFDRLYGIERNTQSQLVAKIPFEEDNGSIILRCRINDNSRELRLLFDTGADGMALSTTLGEELGLKITRSNSASVVGGQVQIQVSDGNTVHIGDFAFAHQGIALFPEYHKGTDGIIGNTLLKSYIVRVDYDQKLLILYTMGQYDFGNKGTLLPVELDGNLRLPISLKMNGGKNLKGEVYFDTGASYNLILFRPFVLKNRLLVDGFAPLHGGSTVSMGMSTPTYTGLAEGMLIGEQLHTDNFLLSLMAGNGKNQNWIPDADGSLGTGIIGRYNFTVDLLNKQIHFEPNKRYSLPEDFVIGDYVFHFDLNGNLFAGKKLSAEGIYNKVYKINGKPVSNWLKKKKLQEELIKTRKKSDLEIDAETDGTMKVLKIEKG